MKTSTKNQVDESQELSSESLLSPFLAQPAGLFADEPDVIPIISLWRPWANWVALGWKPIETRTHNRFRSLVGKRIGIHAAIKWDENWLLAAREFLTSAQVTRTKTFLNIGGAVICTAFVEKERELTAADSAGALIDCAYTLRRGLFLRDIHGIECVPMKGRQGIWKAAIRPSEQAA